MLADSLRLAGNMAMGAEGVPAAMLLWRESLRHAAAIGDQAVVAPSTLSVGAGFYRLGQSDSAMDYVTRARDIATRDGDLRTRGNAIGIAASLSKDRRNLSAAADLYRSASTVRALSGDTRGIAADQNNLGLIAQDIGDLPGARRAFEKAMSINQRDGRRALVALNLGNLAAVASNSGEYSRADSLYREALAIDRATGAEAETGFVLQALGRLQIHQGDYRAAQLTLSEALAIHEKSGAVMDAIAVRTDLASLQGAVGDPETAMSTLRVNEREADSAKAPPELRAALALARGDLALQFGTFTEASAQYTRADQLYAAAGNTLGRAQAQQGRALLLHLRGDDQGASRLIDEVVRKQLAAGDQRSAALSQLLLAQVQHAAAMRRLPARLSRAPSRRCTASATPLEKRQLSHRLVISGFTTAHIAVPSSFIVAGWIVLETGPGMKCAGDCTPALRKRCRVGVQWPPRQPSFALPLASWSTRQRDFTLTNESRDSCRTNGMCIPSLRCSSRGVVTRTMRLRQASACVPARCFDLLARSRTPAPRLVSGETFSWKAVASHLRPDEVLLEYLLTDSASTVFVVTSDTVAAIDLRATHQTLADRVEFARRAMAMPSGAESVPRWRAPLERLYADLIQPVEQRGFLRGKRTLIVVPHAELHFLSFASLISPDAPNRYLIEKFQVDYAPSAMAWVALGQRNRSSSNRNVLAFAPHVDRLPASANEVQAIARIYGARATVRTGAAASKEAFRSAVRTAGTLHLATFGVLNSHNPLYSFVELAPGEKDNGRLEVNEVFGLGLSGQLVVLSACQTALSSGGIADVPPGDDWVGMVQGFLQGGASNVVASLWPVDDRATARLMEQFHQRLAAGVPVGDALAGAQRALIKGKTFNPSDWAAFVVNGGFAQP